MTDAEGCRKCCCRCRSKCGFKLCCIWCCLKSVAEISGDAGGYAWSEVRGHRASGPALAATTAPGCYVLFGCTLPPGAARACLAQPACMGCYGGVYNPGKTQPMAQERRMRLEAGTA